MVTLYLVMLAVPLPAGAARLNHLFEAEVATTGRDNAARDAALRIALEEVLVRLTGSRAALQTHAAAGLIGKPGRLVDQFRYIDIPATEDQARQLRLWVQFDGVTLSRELRQAGLPYWGAVRPDILVWLAVDDHGRRYLLSEDSQAEVGQQAVATALLQATQRQGLPLTLPLLDLEDRRAVKFTDVWGGFLGTVAAASVRYRPQVLITVRLARASAASEWRADWQLVDGSARQSWHSHTADLKALVDAGVADTAAWLAQRYAVVATREGVRTLVVEDIDNLKDYARVSRYLASLSAVDRVDVSRVDDREIVFRLELSADEHNLLQLIALGRVLQHTGDPVAWRFHLNP